MLDFTESWTVGQLKAALADVPDDLKVSVDGEIVTGVRRHTDAHTEPTELLVIRTGDPFDDFGM